MKSKFPKRLLEAYLMFFLALIMALVSATVVWSAPRSFHCGKGYIASRESLENFPLDSRVWLLDEASDLLIVEVPGGIATDLRRPRAKFVFAHPEERIVQVIRREGDNFLILSRFSRGMSVYVLKWSGGTEPVFSHLYSKILEYQAGRKIKSPLVDAVVEGGTVYLLTNFHLLIASLKEIGSGDFNPEAVPLPASSGRGAGLFLNGSRLYLAGMTQGSSDVRMEDYLDPAGGWRTWQQGEGFLPESSALQYRNLLKTYRAEADGVNVYLADSTRRRHSLYAGKTGAEIALLSSFPVAASFLGKDGAALGVVAMSDDWVSLVRGRRFVCNWSGSPQSVVIVRQYRKDQGNWVRMVQLENDGAWWKIDLELP